MDYPTIDLVEVSAYQIPTDSPESDGTLEWDSTTMVLVRLRAGDAWGIGFTYSHQAAANLIADKFRPILENANPMDVCSMWERMLKTSRNLGTAGLVATAIAAVDIALWDLKAKLLGTPLIRLWGELHEEVPVYGSGGFTSYTDKQLAEQFARWMDHGITMFKMKVGRDVVVDRARVRNARIVVGNHRLFVDANGAYSLKQALHEATLFRHDSGVSWLEEPLSSDNLEGLRLMRERGPAGMDIAAGEYGYTPEYFRRMLEAGAADVVQPDVTRVMGFTGFLKAAALCEAHHSPLSAHCAPSLSVQICGATSAARHIEYFHDHVRIENMLFDGVPQPQGGKLRPNSSEPGHGLRFRNHEAEQYRIA